MNKDKLPPPANSKDELPPGITLKEATANSVTFHFGKSDPSEPTRVVIETRRPQNISAKEMELSRR